jgi:hypothetical protein
MNVIRAIFAPPVFIFLVSFWVHPVRCGGSIGRQALPVKEKAATGR